jgi:transcriptional regulator with XRE-family HTH domain
VPRLTATSDQKAALIRLGDAIRARRHALQISQEALAHASGINRTHMGEVERGKRNVSLMAAMEIAAALNCTLSELTQQAEL